MSIEDRTHLLVGGTVIEEVFRVEPAWIPSSSAPGRWPCACCGTGYPVHEGWLIDYYHAPTREMARAYTCAGCAAKAAVLRDRIA